MSLKDTLSFCDFFEILKSEPSASCMVVSDVPLEYVNSSFCDILKCMRCKYTWLLVLDFQGIPLCEHECVCLCIYNVSFALPGLIVLSYLFYLFLSNF